MIRASNARGVDSVRNVGGNLAVGGYTLINLMARYQVTKEIQLSANVNNLTDRTYIANMASMTG